MPSVRRFGVIVRSKDGALVVERVDVCSAACDAPSPSEVARPLRTAPVIQLDSLEWRRVATAQLRVHPATHTARLPLCSGSSVAAFSPNESTAPDAFASLGLLCSPATQPNARESPRPSRNAGPRPSPPPAPSRCTHRAAASSAIFGVSFHPRFASISRLRFAHSQRSPLAS